MTLPLVSSIVGTPAKPAAKPAEAKAEPMAKGDETTFDPNEGASEDAPKKPVVKEAREAQSKADTQTQASKQSAQTAFEGVDPQIALPQREAPKEVPSQTPRVAATELPLENIVETAKPVTKDQPTLPSRAPIAVEGTVAQQVPADTQILRKAEEKAPQTELAAKIPPKVDAPTVKVAAQPAPELPQQTPQLDEIRRDVPTLEQAPAPNTQREQVATTPIRPQVAEVQPAKPVENPKPKLANSASIGKAEDTIDVPPPRDPAPSQPKPQTQQVSATSAPTLALKDAPTNVIPDAPDAPLALDREQRAVETERFALGAPKEAATPRMVQTTQAIAQQITAALSRSLDGVIQIRLDPPELGRLTVTMPTVDAGGTAVVSAERPEVLDLMRRNEHVLQKELQNAGFGNLDFSFSEQQGQDRQNDRDGQAAAQRDQSMSADLDLAFAREGPAGIATLDSIDIRL